MFPRITPSTASETTKPQLIKSGVAALDDMFGGGQEAGTTTLVIGQSGHRQIDHVVALRDRSSRTG